MSTFYKLNKVIKRIKKNMKGKKGKRRSLPKRTKALLIGINYVGTSSALSGCINDVKNHEAILRKNSVTNIRILTDNTGMKPTRKNILDSIDWLVKDSENFDKIYFQYSGHGSNKRDNRNGDEADGRDECLCPLDYGKFGMIRDDTLNTRLVKKAKCELFALIDACHSGTMLDLPNDYRFTPRLDGGYKHNFDNWIADVHQTEKGPATNPRVVMISGCLDSQTSADAWLKNKSQGALTCMYLETLSINNYNVSYEDLMKEIHLRLKLQGFVQKPVLSSSIDLDLEEEFII